jgi:hypothetical protein
MTEAVMSALAARRILNDTPISAGAVADLRALTHCLAGYREPSHRRSIIEILITLVPFILLWLLMWWSLRIGYGIYLFLAVPAAGFLVRLSTRSGPTNEIGASRRPRSTAAHIMTCRSYCAGSPPISGCTTSTTSAAESRFIDYRLCFAATPILRMSAGSL